MALRTRVAALMVGLVAANLAAWAWAVAAFHAHPLLLGTGFLAYGLGLRHAVDADHIAAIDNVTRKLMQDGQRPISVGLFFSLGHSTIVIAASAAIAATAATLHGRLDALHAIGGLVGTIISSAFLLVIAAMNTMIFMTVLRHIRQTRAGHTLNEVQLDTYLANRGLLARILKPVFRIVSRSWHMYPLGLLFGLGFDTATEIGLLGISATEASHGLPIWSIMAFPALFTAGMSLVDTAESLLMMGAYGWAFATPMRKLYYNMTITLLSVIVAVLVSAIEALGLLHQHIASHGTFWRGIDVLNGQFGLLGLAIVVTCLAVWLGSFLAFRRVQTESKPVLF
jgi:high-affinity nickel-transport protein